LREIQRCPDTPTHRQTHRHTDTHSIETGALESPPSPFPSFPAYPQVLYMSNCKVKDWKEFDELKLLPQLVDLIFVGNPLEETHTANKGE
jgi:hypothetical protein